MEKTLYISDLDGTLLNHDQQVPPETVQILNHLINQGLNFSIATARTAATAQYILRDIKINIPIILMNGVALYDLQEQKYVDIEYIDVQVAQDIINKLKMINESGFIYTIIKDKLQAYFDKDLNEYESIFYKERKQRKTFMREKCQAVEKIVYFVFMDSKERLETIASVLQGIREIDYVLYKDNYMEGAYLLEVFSHKASKANAIVKLKAHYDKLVCFGDNLNDLSMFKLADYSCAVANAVEEVKVAATEVIGSNEENGVAKFIERCMK